MADTGYNSGQKPKRPGNGKNGPGDKGKSDGTRHFKPKMPPTNKGGSSGGK